MRGKNAVVNVIAINYARARVVDGRRRTEELSDGTGRST